MQILGINFKSKAEREQDEKKYKERIFPGGEEEREKVCRELVKRLPGKDEKDVLCTCEGPDDRSRPFF